MAFKPNKDEIALEAKGALTAVALETDFEAHNAEVEEVWESYRAGTPIRVPVILGIATRYTLFHPEINASSLAGERRAPARTSVSGVGAGAPTWPGAYPADGYTFEQYFTDPEVRVRHQLARQWWISHNMLQDAPMGPPESYTVWPDLQNVHEALWFGAQLYFAEGEVPDVRPTLRDDNKWEIFDRGLPDPFEGWYGRAWEWYDWMRDYAEKNEYRGRPIHVDPPSAMDTDGPLTVACSVRGATEVMTDIYADPDYFHKLMDFITDGIILRIRAFRQRLGKVPTAWFYTRYPREEGRAWGFADDSLQLVSTQTYIDHILPYHKRMIEAFGPIGPNSIHLCGDASRHFVTMRDELKAYSFDTGFPVDHGQLRRDLGPEVEILGGPHVELLRQGPPERVVEETKRILGSGVMEGGRFILRDANNLAPHTPPEHIAAMYETCRTSGRYDQSRSPL